MPKDNKNLNELTYNEFIESVAADNDLVELANQIEDNSAKTCPSDDVSEEGVTVVVKDGLVSDSDAKLSYSNRNQTIYAHTLTHMWWNFPEKTKWTRLQVAREHTRTVAKLVSNGWGHMIKDTLDDSLPQSLTKDYAPSTGEEIVKPTKIIIVTNGKREEVAELKTETMSRAPIADSSGLQNDLIVDVGSMRVILNQSDFEPSVKDVDDDEYKKFLDNDVINELGTDEEGLYLRVNAMHEGTWNFTEISKEELESAAHTFVGRLVIEGHKWDDPERSLGEVLKANVKFDPEHQKFYLELIVKITKARGIKEVKAGRYKFVSIGASMKARCNICGLTVNEGCHHIRGIEYDTEEHGRIICIKTATEIVFEELSFINVPAARWARVLEQIDPNQVRELLAASKSGNTVSIEIETDQQRLLPTLDEMLSFQEDGIIKLNKRNEEVTGMSDKKGKKDQEGNETFVTPPGSDVTGAQPASTPQNTTKKPVATTPAPKKSKSKGNISDVASPAKPLDGGTVDTGKNGSSGEDAPAPQPSPSKGNVSKVSATEHPKDGGTVDTGVNPGASDVKGPTDNPVVDSDEITVDSVTITLTNEQLDEMDIGAIYEFAKNNEMTGMIEALVAANVEGECATPIINAATADEAILAHALLHRWEEDLTLTNWNEEQIKAEHDRIVNTLSDFGIGHEGAAEDTTVVNDDTTDEGAAEAADAAAEGAAEAADAAAEGAEADSSSVTDAPAKDETAVDANADTIVDPDTQLLTIQLENIQADNKLLQEKFDAATSEILEVKENLSKELYDVKLALAKSLRENKNVATELSTIDGLLTAKTAELEALNTQLEQYVQKELGEVVESIVQIKTDLNKYADDAATEADREKFRSMSLEVLVTLASELKAVKNHSLKNKVAEEHGIGDASAADESTDAFVSGDSEIEKYGQENDTQEDKDEKKDFEVAEGSVLALVKDSLNV